MKSILSNAVLFLFLIFCASIFSAYSQSKESWHRVITGDGYAVDVEESSLQFSPDRTVSGKFRTVYTKGEPLQSDPKTRYKTRIETIEFRLTDRGYRSADVSLLDEKGGVIGTSPGQKDWRSSAGGSGARWLAALQTLAPLRAWKVAGYKLIDMGPAGVAGSPDLDQLSGSDVRFSLDAAYVGKKQCSLPRYETRKLETADLEKILGVKIEPLGFAAAPIDIVALNCDRGDWQAGQNVLVKVAPDRMLMLWSGALLELTDDVSKEFRLPFKIIEVRDKSVFVKAP